MEAFSNGVDKFSTNEIVGQTLLSDYTFLITVFWFHFFDYPGMQNFQSVANPFVAASRPVGKKWVYR